MEQDFAAILRAAVHDRGLSLDSLRRELARHGHELSAATLSYWQSGRSQPERASSLLALRTLEEVLRVPPGHLASALTPRRRGREARIEPSEQRLAVPGQAGQLLEDLAASLGLSWDHGLERISVHDRMQLRDDRTEESHAVREIIRAVRPGVDRYPMWYRGEDLGGLPMLTAVENCRLGRVAQSPPDNVIVVEMLLERPLLQGESVLVEHLVEIRGNREPVMWWTRWVNHRVREIHLEVKFHPADLPIHVERFVQQNAAPVIEPVALSGPTAHLLTLDFGPGTCGLRWDWADAQAPALT